MLETLNLKTLQRIGTLRQIPFEGEQNSSMNPGPDIDFVDEHDSPIYDNQTMTKYTPKKYDLRKSVKPSKILDL